MSSTFLRRTAFVVLVALAVSACGGDVGGGGHAIEDPRARSTAPTAERGAVYFDLVNNGDDDVSIVAARVDAGIAGVVELHETVAAGDEGEGAGGMDEGDGDMDGMGAMQMREVPSIDAAAGETVRLEPGGLHVMLLDLTGPLEAGVSFELTLVFADATEETVSVEIRDEV